MFMIAITILEGLPMTKTLIVHIVLWTILVLVTNTVEKFFLVTV